MSHAYEPDCDSLLAAANPVATARHALDVCGRWLALGISCSAAHRLASASDAGCDSLSARPRNHHNRHVHHWHLWTLYHPECADSFCACRFGRDRPGIAQSLDAPGSDWPVEYFESIE